MVTDFDAVVLAGGRGRRLGGVDKAGMPVADRPMLQRVLDAVAHACSVTVVGPRRDVDSAGVEPTWTREDPPWSGPLSALTAGLVPGNADTVVVAACDLPLLDARVVDRLRDTLRRSPHAAGAMLVDEHSQRQPLAAAYRRGELSAALATIGDPRDRPMWLLRAELAVVTVAAPLAAWDADTPDDLTQIETHLRGQTGTSATTPTSTEGSGMLTDWAREVTEALQSDLQTDQELVDRILELARETAHSVERPAAPLTTFLVGYAAARRGGGLEAITACDEAARALARRRADDEER